MSNIDNTLKSELKSKLGTLNYKTLRFKDSKLFGGVLYIVGFNNHDSFITFFNNLGLKMNVTEAYFDQLVKGYIIAGKLLIGNDGRIERWQYCKLHENDINFELSNILNATDTLYGLFGDSYEIEKIKIL